jgi:Kdo2-lipid IVA lauroyltransferase/acyltransferase
MLKRVWQDLITVALRGLVFLAKLTPRTRMVRAAGALGLLAFYVSGRYRRVAYKNLRMTFGIALSDTQVVQITRKVFETFAKSFIAEFPWSASATPEMLRKLVDLRPEDRVVIDNLLSMNRGMIVTTAHFGNFELLGPRFQADGYKIAVVVRNDNNSKLAESINNVRRHSYDVIPRGQAAKQVIKRLKAGWVVAMLPDQKSDDLLLSFFGLPTGTVAGPAVMALRTGAPILPIYCVRQEDDTHKIELGEPILPVTTADYESDIRRIMSSVNESIETIVRRYPGQWLWLHDRWRNVPELVARAAGEDGMAVA